MLKTLSALFFSVLLCGVVQATTVYKWDEGGKTIYSQTPPPPGVKFEIVIENKIGKSTDVAKANASSSSSSFEERREQRLQEKNEQDVLKESNRIKQENCTIAKKNMESLSSHGQVTIKEGDIYRKLTEEERQERIQETQTQLDEFCQG